MSAKTRFSAIDAIEPRTWVEIKKAALRHNYDAVRRRLAKGALLMAVVKSNAYGHGLTGAAKIFSEGGAEWLAVDGLEEAAELKAAGITAPVIVLGATLPENFRAAAAMGITITVSTRVWLEAIARMAKSPKFHLKIDTGMHRQGFLPLEIGRVIEIIKRQKGAREALTGIYTHFAAAKDPIYPYFTEQQFEEFMRVAELFKRAGFINLFRHCAASAGTLLNKKYHLDGVRVGMALYGYFPSREIEAALGEEIKLKPAMDWKAVITEVKDVPDGAYVGYDLTERLRGKRKLAVVPVGYWHGLPRTLSSRGRFVVKGKPVRIVGRVSMDMTVIDVTGIAVAVGDEAIFDIQHGIDTSEMIPYEFLSRINPLIERRYI